MCFTLTILWVSANANFESFEHFRPLALRGHFWRRARHAPGFNSDQSPAYSDFLESKPSIDSGFEVAKPEGSWHSSLKKEPKENKHLKKLISSVYTITDKDSQNYKDTVLKSGVPYCQEIRTKRTGKDNSAKDTLVCYKCKNPKNGATYEQCSYVSKPVAEGNVEAPPGFRSRRSNSEEGVSDFGNRDRDSYKRESPYRFSERIFSDATEEAPQDYKGKDEKCEKVVKDSMVCMVCKNTKGNGKYEQCSYVHQPSEKKYSFSKSSSFKNPEGGKIDDGDDKGQVDRGYSEKSESKPVREYSVGKGSESGEESKDSNCRKVEKDSRTCTVCKDPETGGNYEKCAYTYQPDDQVYKFSRSKSFGYPRGDSKEGYQGEDSGHQGSKPSESLKSASDEYSRGYSIPESYYEKSRPSSSSSYLKRDEPSSSYHPAASEESESHPEERESSGYKTSKSESERIAESMEPSNCKEVQKDSMTCKVCKDPKTGSNSEQCSYQYQPNDKSYSFTRSKSFGSPTKAGDESHDGSEVRESREPSFKDRSYDFSKRPYAGQREPRKELHEFAAPSEPKAQVKEEPAKDTGDFYDAFQKKAEIQKFLQEFQKEDRSKCKKVMREKMTCYQCVDEKGFRKEECAFVTSDNPEEAKDSSIEEAEVEPEPTKKISRSVIKDVDEYIPLELEASASENVGKHAEPEIEALAEEKELKEAEPYEYVAETRPVFDKVLGITLPAFMLSTSEHEKEFDRAMASRF